MLVIRQEQIDALIRGTDEEFVEDLVATVKDGDPDLEDYYDDETLREMVRGGLEKAERQGFTRAEDLTVYVSLMFKIAPNFDTHPAIKAIIENRRIPPEQRFERMQSPAFPEKAWLEARENYDEDAWGLEFAEDD